MACVSGRTRGGTSSTDTGAMTTRTWQGGAAVGARHATAAADAVGARLGAAAAPAHAGLAAADGAGAADGAADRVSDGQAFFDADDGANDTAVAPADYFAAVRITTT